MKVKNGKIVECTDNELFNWYLKNNWDDLYSYPDYKEKCIQHGTKITEE